MDDYISNDTSICSDEVTKNALDLITKKESNYTRAPTCQMTKILFKFKKVSKENTNLVWITFSNPSVTNYHTYISYTLGNLIGEVGGILGLTLGVSALTFLESLLNWSPYY